MSHSPEPWKVERIELPAEWDVTGDCAYNIIDSRGRCVATDGTDADREDQERIVACVNACSGISTKDLQKHGAKAVIDAYSIRSSDPRATLIIAAKNLLRDEGYSILDSRDE